MVSESLFKVDFVEEDAGKLRKQAKQRFTWTFQSTETGAAPPPPPPPPPSEDLLGSAGDFLALPPSQNITPTMPEAVTKTHSVCLTWSYTTGKQLVEMNGEEVWFGRKPGAAVFSHSWTSRDGSLRLEILATRKAPVRNVAPDFRCHDLMINGRLFEDLPSINGDQGTHSTTISQFDLPRSIVDILYPDGYTQEKQALWAAE